MLRPSGFQRKVFNTLAILGLSRVQIIQQDNGSFKIKDSKFWQRILYIILRINTLSKFIFLILLSCGLFQEEFEFFEKMAILLWFLIVLLLAISEKIFYKKYPFFEILTAWWKIEESIFIQLGKPRKFLKDLRWIALWRVWFQGIIALVGILAVIVQYNEAPKYCVFVYSIIEKEENFLKILCGVHEVLFLVHAWLVYGSVIYLSSVIGAEFTYNIDALSQVLDLFTQMGFPSKSLSSSFSNTPVSSAVAHQIRHRPFHRGLSILDDYAIVDDDNTLWSLSRRVRYDPLALIREYVHVHTIITQLNNFASYNFLYMHGCSYVQMVSDVFQMIQILRGPDADFLAVLFFAEDMMVCMYMLFRCFKSMAFLQPSSTSFLEKFRYLLVSSSTVSFSQNKKHVLSKVDSKLLMKIKPTLHTAAFKLGPCLVGPWTVGIAMDVLLQYYICVALWN